MLQLDENTHDLFVENFQFKEITTKTQDLGQRLKIKLLFYKGEWFLDEEYGIPYFQEVFVKGTTREDLDNIFKLAIASEPDVDELLTYTSEFTPSTRVFKVDAKIKTTEGVVYSLSLNL